MWPSSFCNNLVILILPWTHFHPSISKTKIRYILQYRHWPPFQLMAKTENLPPKNLLHLHLLHVSRFASPGAESASFLVGFAAFAFHCKHHMHLDVRLEPGIVADVPWCVIIGGWKTAAMLARCWGEHGLYLSDNISLVNLVTFLFPRLQNVTKVLTILTALDALLTEMQASTMDTHHPSHRSCKPSSGTSFEWHKVLKELPAFLLVGCSDP